MEIHERLAAYDDALRSKYGPIVAGIDEVGRGALAGPMVAACVIFAPHIQIVGVNDSKKLNSDQRNDLDLLIKEKCLAYGIGIASPEYIDAKGLSAANIHVMKSAAEAAIKLLPDNLDVSVFVIDQSPYSGLKPQVMLPKGDGTSLAVAAASIVAKVYRDNLMKILDEEYPGYGLLDNKGYINAVHTEAIKKLGLANIHRKSYKVKALEKNRQITLMDMI
jgi:ribonuclease HII